MGRCIYSHDDGAYCDKHDHGAVTVGCCGEEFVLTEGTPDMNEYHFCPNCGAMMEES